MRICDLHTGRNLLTRSAKRLREQWQRTAEHWTDENRLEFEQRHLQPLAPRVKLLLTAVHSLSDILEQAQRECCDEFEEQSL